MKASWELTQVNQEFILQNYDSHRKVLKRGRLLFSSLFLLTEVPPFQPLSSLSILHSLDINYLFVDGSKIHLQAGLPSSFPNPILELSSQTGPPQNKTSLLRNGTNVYSSIPLIYKPSTHIVAPVSKTHLKTLYFSPPPSSLFEPKSLSPLVLPSVAASWQICFHRLLSL